MPLSFADTLNLYLDEYSLTVSALADAAGVSKATLSRFKNGKREPSVDSDVVERLAQAIAEFAAAQAAEAAMAEDTGAQDAETSMGAAGDAAPAADAAAAATAEAPTPEDAARTANPPTAEHIAETLKKTLGTSAADFDRIAANLNMLIDALGINANDLSRYLKFDPSYLSRIRSGQRRPANVSEFCNGVASFVCSHITERQSASLAHLIDCTEEETLDPPACRNLVLKWLSAGVGQHDDSVQHFLEKLDEFDLNEYIRTIKFDELKVPSAPFQLPLSKTCYRAEGYMESELDWLKATVLSRSDDSVIMYSDMPFEDMANNDEYRKKWMYGMALMLKKGLHLNVIHNVDRSVYEMIMGLEGWIPLYMTGQVSPYYFKGFADPVFHHFLRVSGAAAVSGESVVGFQNDGCFRLSKGKEEVAYMRKRGEELLMKARPLMEIYTDDNGRAFSVFLQSALNKQNIANRNIRSTPPLHTISDDLLQRMLDRNQVSDANRREIMEYVADLRSFISRRIQNDCIYDEIPQLSREEFERYPLSLFLADIFYSDEVLYSYEDYQEHLRLTQQFAETHPNYQFTLTENQPFRNIQIRMTEGEFVVVSKNKAPAIHFVIRHPKLRQAIENLSVPIAE